MHLGGRRGGLQERYEAIREPGDPAAFDELLAQRDPLTPVKMQANLIIKALDNDIVGAHLNQMRWATIDLSGVADAATDLRPPGRNLQSQGAGRLLSIPISATKMFVAANEEAIFAKLRAVDPCEIVADVNSFVVVRARRFVWAQDASQETFIVDNMSAKLEPMPLLPNIGRYEPPPPQPLCRC